MAHTHGGQIVGRCREVEGKGGSNRLVNEAARDGVGKHGEVRSTRNTGEVRREWEGAVGRRLHSPRRYVLL